MLPFYAIIITLLVDVDMIDWWPDDIICFTQLLQLLCSKIYIFDIIISQNLRGYHLSQESRNQIMRLFALIRIHFMLNPLYQCQWEFRKKNEIKMEILACRLRRSTRVERANLHTGGQSSRGIISEQEIT